MPRDQSKNLFQPTAIYQIFSGRWSCASLIHHPGQVFARLARHDYSALNKIGISHIYLLGVFDSTGPVIVTEEEGVNLTKTDNRLPSVFALSDHTRTHPHLGSIFALQNLINTLHSQGFAVILDFVPNHTGTTHPWVKDHPDYYHQANGQPIAEFSGDVYKLNYDNPALREEMIRVIMTIAGWGADGIRCDMAHLVPIDFWHKAIKTVRHSHPDFLFTAEIYPPSPFDLSSMHHHLEAGFDAIYHGPMYNNFKQIFTDHHPLDHLLHHLNFVIGDFAPGSLINYFSNHDDSLPAGAEPYIEALLALNLFLPGIPFIYNGSLNGHHHRLAHHYFQELSQEELEINSLPGLYQQIFDYRLKVRPQITLVKIETNGLVTADLYTNQGSAILCLNLTGADQSLGLYHRSNPGLLHQFTSTDFLPLGSAEIFNS